MTRDPPHIPVQCGVDICSEGFKTDTWETVFAGVSIAGEAPTLAVKLEGV